MAVNYAVCTPGLAQQIGLLVLATVLALVGTYVYARYALRHGITAAINFRSLHKEVLPRGGGIVFALVFSATSIAAWFWELLPTPITLLIGVGGAAAGIFGFLDDVMEVRPLIKIIAHGFLGAWGVIALYRTPHLATLADLGALESFLIGLALMCIFVWFINLYNFIDGIDGMAASGSVFIGSSAVLILIMSGGEPTLVFIFALLTVCSAGFLVFNLPPARIFMGDSGSIFLGYAIAGLAILTILSRQMSVWTWLAVLSYFVGDTSVTGAYRMIRVPKWYRAHRSHAYQNLARIYDSHALVTYGVTAYNVLWALPMALWTVFAPEYAPVAVTLALAPVVLWTLRFGPRLSSS